MMTSHPHSASMGLPSGFRRDAPRTDRDPIWTSPRYYNYVRDMMSRFSRELKLRRLLESEANPDRNPVPQDLQPLSVEVTEFYVRQNAASHHTEAYELTSMCPAGGETSGQGQQGGSLRGSPVLRRGQDFFFAVRFDRAPEYKTDAIRLIFSFGPNPQSTKGTRAVLPVPLEPRANGGSKKDSWEASVQRKEGKTLILEVRIPSTAPVGIWRCSVECERGMSRFVGGGRGAGRRRGAEGDEGESNQGPPPQLARREHRCDVDIYILFNPWCKEDGVYMEEEWQRKEYVESDSGKVWVGGSFRQPVGRRWVFGQFEDVVLPATMCLLELSRLRHEERGDPVRVSRAVSAVVNSVDDDGLLVGRWHGDYKDGHAPTAWTGSVAILEEYLRSGGQSVRYGQCWVFSALTVTLCRALGIPCRSVTNFVSAHDGNQTLCVERYFDQSGCEMLDHECSGDSLWNFHTWNDAWMSRPDLPPGYGGWQAIDATPQEQSEKMMQCGPAPLAAVRSGQVGFAFDTAFVFAEVNADVVHFQEDPDSPWGFSRLKVDQYHVGRRIVTKNPKFDDDFGDNDLEDITDQYKNPEGSMGERLATFSALKTAGSARGYFGFPEDALPEDVCFSLEELDSVPYGESFSVKVKIQNKSGEKRTISAVLSVHSVRYTGALAHRIKTSSVEFEMQPLSDETMVLRVSPKEYLQRVDRDHCLLKMNAIAHVAQTKQSWSEEDDFCLRKPRFNVQVTGTPRVGAECTVVLSFQNPLTEMPLTNCTLSVEGPGLQRPRISRQRDVKPGELVTLTERFFPRKSGQRRIVATFDSQELAEITGSAVVTVAD
ncbi:hemocyte protein-glutamine gamma-glutamyltransferase-like [Ischnura elegans]|uniref:hemocyte protein-glutamine gamma-glutamyltransferase-like n=1 Tax=Ischnura elegans TaxID=197161 RepID=UPI001ED8961C|nr:hemocyte protein-glutamine gamma-glutamyltransferase-like [Ischnura elegans]